MTNTAILIIRLLAVYLFTASAVYLFTASAVYIPSGLPGFVRMLSIDWPAIPTPVITILVFIEALIYLLILPVVLWKVAPWLARRIVPGSAPEEAPTPLSQFEFLRLGLVLIGLLLIPTALAQFAYGIYSLLFFPEAIDVAQRVMHDQALQSVLITHGIKLVFGICLVVYSAAIAKKLESRW